MNPLGGWERSPRDPSASGLFLRGVMTIAVLCAVAALLGTHAQGGFDDRFELLLEADQVGDGLMVGAPVKHRGFVIGTVDEITALADGTQQVRLSIDPAEASGLGSDVEPGYSSANLFGTTAIELVSNGPGGEPLRSGQRLRITGDATVGTVTGVMNRTTTLTDAFTSSEMLAAIDGLADNAGPIARTARAYLTLLGDAREERAMSVRDFLGETTDILDGIRAVLTPTIGVVNTTMDASRFLETAAGQKRTIAAVSGLSSRLVLPVAEILADHRTSLGTIIAVALDIGLPLVLSVGTIPDAYNRIGNLLADTEFAFTGAPDRPHLELEVLFDVFPQGIGPVLRSSGGTQ
ncbi:MlaD family protein [Gordonia aurantiaca]|uniref:MlaD family protein n=1 Tax=Gordonia sp. B21 TaxID=3151852 RepID=UPI003263F8CB